MKHAIGSVYSGGQKPAVVQAKTKKRMVEIINEHCCIVSMKHFTDYWLPGNHEEIKKHFGDEEGLWICDDTPKKYDYKNYIKVT